MLIQRLPGQSNYYSQKYHLVCFRCVVFRLIRGWAWPFQQQLNINSWRLNSNMLSVIRSIILNAWLRAPGTGILPLQRHQWVPWHQWVRLPLLQKLCVLHFTLMSSLILSVNRYFFLFLPLFTPGGGCIRDSSDVGFCSLSWVAITELPHSGWETGSMWGHFWSGTWGHRHWHLSSCVHMGSSAAKPLCMAKLALHVKCCVQTASEWGNWLRANWGQICFYF